MGFEILGLDINLYGILIATAFLIALLIVSYFSKIRGFSKDLPYELLLIVFPLAIIGARIYYIVFSGRSWTFREAIAVQDGGLAIYGGIIAAFLGLLVYSYFKKINILRLTDMIAPALLLGQSIGRWGNFFNQEAYGYAVENTSLQWFPFAVYIDGSGWHLATFFYESFWNMIGFLLLILVYLKYKNIGYATSFYLVFYGIGRAIIEGFRTDSLYIGSGEIIRVSQVLSIILVFVGIGLFFFSKYKINKN